MNDILDKKLMSELPRSIVTGWDQLQIFKQDNIFSDNAYLLKYLVILYAWLYNVSCEMDFDDRMIQDGLSIVSNIANERNKTLELLKQALIGNDDIKIKHYARQICGINDESCRISESINTRTE